MTGKYAPLGRYLHGLTTNRWKAAFQDVETVIDARLPRSARERDAWWGNDGSHVQARAWMDVGWKTRDVDFQREVISFYREGTPVVRPEDGRSRNHALLPSRSTQSETPVREREHFASEVTELMLGGEHFGWFDHIEPETGPDGLPLECMPQAKYAKAAQTRLNRHGQGPFCRFSVSGLPATSGVYAVTVGRILKYVGIANDLRQRWGPQGYARIHPKNCYVGGQSTNCKVNNRILRAAKEGSKVELWIHETPDPRLLEERLIDELDPPWNAQR